MRRTRRRGAGARSILRQGRSAPSAPHSRLPLVFATPRATEQARRLLPGRVVENEVGRAIKDGRITHVRSRQAAFVVGPGWRAKVRQIRGRANPERKAWQVVSVEARTWLG